MNWRPDQHVASRRVTHASYRKPLSQVHCLSSLKPTNTEQALYNNLRDNQFGKNLRLEQEKIGFRWVELEIRES